MSMMMTCGWFVNQGQQYDGLERQDKIQRKIFQICIPPIKGVFNQFIQFLWNQITHYLHWAGHDRNTTPSDSFHCPVTRLSVMSHSWSKRLNSRRYILISSSYDGRSRWQHTDVRRFDVGHHALHVLIDGRRVHSEMSQGSSTWWEYMSTRILMLSTLVLWCNHSWHLQSLSLALLYLLLSHCLSLSICYSLLYSLTSISPNALPLTIFSFPQSLPTLFYFSPSLSPLSLLTCHISRSSILGPLLFMLIRLNWNSSFLFYRSSQENVDTRTRWVLMFSLTDL